MFDVVLVSLPIAHVFIFEDKIKSYNISVISSLKRSFPMIPLSPDIDNTATNPLCLS